MHLYHGSNCVTSTIQSNTPDRKSNFRRRKSKNLDYFFGRGGGEMVELLILDVYLSNQRQKNDKDLP